MEMDGEREVLMTLELGGATRHVCAGMDDDDLTVYHSILSIVCFYRPRSN